MNDTISSSDVGMMLSLPVVHIIFLVVTGFGRGSL